MVVAVAGLLQVYRGGAWTSDLVDKPTASTLSLTANYTTTGAPWGPAQVLRNGNRMALQGSVTNTFTPTSGTKGTEYQIGTLPSSTAPLNPISTAVAWGDGVSFVGSAILIVRPDLSVNFIPPANFTTGAIHTMSLAVISQWIIGL
jgi:hypothetical protein